MKRFTVILLSLLAVCGQLSGKQTSDKRSGLQGKEAFDHVFPTYVSFRAESNKDTAYDIWASKQEGASVILKKFMQEEIEVNPETAEWADKYVRRHPETMLMLHLNGEARQITGHTDVLKRYFPGHWVYLPGSVSLEDVSETGTVFHVADVRPFMSKGYLKRNTASPEYIPLKVLVVRLGPDGERLWYESEYATVTGYDEAAKTVTLERGLYGSTPISYTGGKSYIAPIPGSVWGVDAMWYYNLSSVCPRDRDGKMAKDVYAEEIASWFAEGGPLARFDGIGFDVNYFDRGGKWSKWDVDNDGTSDSGWFGGKNLWLEGDLDFLAQVRKALTDSRVMTCDGQLTTNQQAPALMNGIESEGLLEPTDSWRGFSKAVNTHLYWDKRITREEKFRYVVMKVMGKDEERDDEIRRFSAGTAFCLGAAVTVSGNKSYVPSRFRAPGSLGHIAGELIRTAKHGTPVVSLSGEGLLNAIDQTGCSARIDGGKVYVKPSGSEGETSYSFKIKGVPVPDGDMTVFVTARAVEPLNEYAQEYRIPRFFYLKPDKLPEYDEDPRYNDMFTQLYGMFDTSSPEEMSFFYRDMEKGSTDMTVTVSGRGEIELSSLVIYNRPDVLVREFDKGIVIVNPSLREAVVNLSEFIPGQKPGVTAISSLNSLYIEK